MAHETSSIIDLGAHDKRNLPRVITFLHSQDIRGHNIFTEASGAVKDNHPFFGKLSIFLVKQKAIEIHEPDYEKNMRRATKLYEDTLSPVLKAIRDSAFGLPPWVVISEFDRLNQTICQVRDPVIAKQITDNRPIYSIFGSGHIPGVLAILREQSVVKIEVLTL